MLTMISTPIMVSHLGKSMNPSVDNYKHMTEHNMACVVNMGDYCKEQAEDMAKNLKRTLNKSLEEVSELSHSLMKCKDAKGMLDIQQKMFEVGYKSSMKYCMDMMESIKELTEKNTKMMTRSFDHNMRSM